MTASAAVDAMAERYQVDDVKMKMELLSAFAKKARMPSQHLSLAEQAAWLMIEAQVGEDFDRAVDLARAGGRRRRTGTRQRTCDAGESRFERVSASGRRCRTVQNAQATLVQTPDDRFANSAVGIYYCGLKNDWEKGCRTWRRETIRT